MSLLLLLLVWIALLVSCASRDIYLSEDWDTWDECSDLDTNRADRSLVDAFVRSELWTCVAAVEYQTWVWRPSVEITKTRTQQKKN